MRGRNNHVVSHRLAWPSCPCKQGAPSKKTLVLQSCCACACWATCLPKPTPRWVKSLPLASRPLVKSSVALLTEEGVRALQHALPLTVRRQGKWRLPMAARVG